MHRGEAVRHRPFYASAAVHIAGRPPPPVVPVPVVMIPVVVVPVVVVPVVVVPPVVIHLTNDEPTPPRVEHPVAVIPPAVVVVAGHGGGGARHHHHHHRQHHQNQLDAPHRDRLLSLGDLPLDRICIFPNKIMFITTPHPPKVGLSPTKSM